MPLVVHFFIQHIDFSITSVNLIYSSFILTVAVQIIITR